MKYKTRTLTKTDRTKSDLSSGWYTKEDMQKILKWNATLFQNIVERNMFETNVSSTHLMNYELCFVMLGIPAMMKYLCLMGVKHEIDHH